MIVWALVSILNTLLDIFRMIPQVLLPYSIDTSADPDCSHHLILTLLVFPSQNLKTTDVSTAYSVTHSIIAHQCQHASQQLCKSDTTQNIGVGRYWRLRGLKIWLRAQKKNSDHAHFRSNRAHFWKMRLKSIFSTKERTVSQVRQIWLLLSHMLMPSWA